LKLTRAGTNIVPYRANTMEYASYMYLWPPRPESKIPVGMTGFYDRKSWTAQAKLNGTCSVIFANGEQCIIKTRHDDDHKAWTPKTEHVEFFKSTAVNGNWNVFVAELMHNKGPLIKDMLYVFDVLVYQGCQLIGQTFAARQALLEQIIPGNETELWYEHSRQIVRARNHTGNSRELYQRISEIPYVEGLVLKDPNAALGLCNRKDNNTGWQVKCRKTTKNYGF